MVKTQLQWLEETIAKNKRLYSGFVMELEEKPAEAGKDPVVEKSEEPKNNSAELAREAELKEILDEVEALREENAALKNNNQALNSQKESQYDRMKQVLMGRGNYTVAELDKLQDTEKLSAPQIPADYLTAELDLS